MASDRNGGHFPSSERLKREAIPDWLSIRRRSVGYTPFSQSTVYNSSDGSPPGTSAIK
ncbi:MAG: hypothetical protein IT427_06975 [Pirellulales bacterium]|nr:hypothetical protein [Pirellulales bacterium]